MARALWFLAISLKNGIMGSLWCDFFNLVRENRERSLPTKGTNSGIMHDERSAVSHQSRIEHRSFIAVRLAGG
jgi:hypothetical protein